MSQRWFTLMSPMLRYSYSRDAYVLRGVGRRLGPVLRPERRIHLGIASDGVERRGEHLAV
jgi:hypothetical protein